MRARAARLGWLTAALLCAVVLAAGCGDDDSDDATFTVTSEVVSHETTQDILVFAPDAAGPWPVVWAMHGIGGTGEDMAEMAARLAGEGFVVFAPTFGTENMLEASQERGVERFINLGTDKAVYPINAYGISKALAEKIVMAAAGKNMTSGDGTIFCAVRYGNVMGSRGSVIPLFLRQIEEGGAVTVTDGSMTRFLLRLEQATDLVLHAIERGAQGRMYIKKTPGCTVDVLIEALEMHFGRALERTVIGVRPGEKIHETLITADELSRHLEEPDTFGEGSITAIRSYFECKMVPDPVVYDKFAEEIPTPGSDFTSKDTQLLDAAETLQLVKQANIL